MVVLAPPGDGAPDVVGSDYVQRLVRVARELPALSGQAPRLYVVTRSAQTVLAGDTVNLEQAGARGLLRVIGAEHPYLRPTHIDVDERTDPEQLARQLLTGSEEDETAWRNDQWYTARLCPVRCAPMSEKPRSQSTGAMECACRSARPATCRRSNSPRSTACPRARPDRGRRQRVQRELRRRAARLRPLPRVRQRPAPTRHRFRRCRNRGGARRHRSPRRGPRGRHDGNGCWGSFVTCDARLATTVPRGLTDAQAAAVTTAHATAWHGLHELARIKAEDKVLIHSATGGVGQAAIAIARTAGAEIFATAGSAKRRQLLRDMGITHVYDSRSVGFADQIRDDTSGYGVDIVLNSLTGAAMSAGIKLLSFGGRFVEIGKRDIYGDTRLGLFPFRRNLMFYAVDLGLMSLTHPGQIRELLATVYRLTAEGTLPMPESTHYPLTDAATAIRAMSAAEHTGKLFWTFRSPGAARLYCRLNRFGSHGPTALTSSRAAWVASGCFWPRRWPLQQVGPAPAESYWLPGPRPTKRPRRQSNSSAPPDPTSLCCVATSPTPARRSGW